jgi:hypothetical protein
MPPSAAKAIPPVGPCISLPVIVNVSAESSVLMQAPTAKGFAR